MKGKQASPAPSPSPPPTGDADPTKSNLASEYPLTERIKDAATYLREVADKIEAGDIEALWVATTPTGDKGFYEANLLLMGRDPDHLAAALLYLFLDRAKLMFLDQIGSGDRFRTMADGGRWNYQQVPVVPHRRGV